MPLLRLTEQERRGLAWIRQRAGLWIVALRKRRKYLPPGGYSEEEAATLRAVIDLEQAATRLLEGARYPRPACPPEGARVEAG